MHEADVVGGDSVMRGVVSGCPVAVAGARGVSRCSAGCWLADDARWCSQFLQHSKACNASHALSLGNWVIDREGHEPVVYVQLVCQRTARWAKKGLTISHTEDPGRGWGVRVRGGRVVVVKQTFTWVRRVMGT